MEENIVIRNEKKEDWVNVNHWDFVKSIEEEPRLSS